MRDIEDPDVMCVHCHAMIHSSYRKCPFCGEDWMEIKPRKRYTVISLLTPRGPEYRIYDQVTGATIEGGFDTQKWAEAVAEMMEEKWRHDTKRENGTKRRKPNADKKQDNRDY